MDVSEWQRIINHRLSTYLHAPNILDVRSIRGEHRLWSLILVLVKVWAMKWVIREKNKARQKVSVWGRQGELMPLLCSTRNALSTMNILLKNKITYLYIYSVTTLSEVSIQAFFSLQYPFLRPLYKATRTKTESSIIRSMLACDRKL